MRVTTPAARLPHADAGKIRMPLSAFALDIKGGIVASISCLVFSIANGALIYSGASQPMLEKGIVAGLLTTVAVSIVLALTSTFRPVIGTANANTGAPLGAVVAGLAPAFAAQTPEIAAATVHAVVAAATLTAGVLLFLLGSARLGRIVRFIPFPILAGFMGVTGILLLFGSVRLSTGVPVSWSRLPDLFSPGHWPLLGAQLCFAVLIGAVSRKFKHFLAIPILLAVTIVLADAVCYGSGYSIETPPLPGFFLASKALALVSLSAVLPAFIGSMAHRRPGLWINRGLRRPRGHGDSSDEFRVGSLPEHGCGLRSGIKGAGSRLPRVRRSWRFRRQPIRRPDGRGSFDGRARPAHGAYEWRGYFIVLGSRVAAVAFYTALRLGRHAGADRCLDHPNVVRRVPSENATWRMAPRHRHCGHYDLGRHGGRNSRGFHRRMRSLRRRSEPVGYCAPRLRNQRAILPARPVPCRSRSFGAKRPSGSFYRASRDLILRIGLSDFRTGQIHNRVRRTGDGRFRLHGGQRMRFHGNGNFRPDEARFCQLAH